MVYIGTERAHLLDKVFFVVAVLSFWGSPSDEIMSDILLVSLQQLLPQNTYPVHKTNKQYHKKGEWGYDHKEETQITQPQTSQQRGVNKPYYLVST